MNRKKVLASIIAAIIVNGVATPSGHAQTNENAAPREVEASSDPASSPESGKTSDVVQLKSIRVTARRVEEQSQDVPLPITVITSETIENKGFEDVQDIARFTPGFTFHEGFGRTMDRPIIRGQVNVQGEANASFFIDGVFVGGNISGYDLSDIDRVEVIRGPQSALFGRRTFSGAVNFITKRPGPDGAGSARLQFGNHGQEQARISYSKALGDTLAFRLNAYSDKTDGMFYNTVSEKNDLGGRKTNSVGGSLYWNPNAAFSATLRVNYQENEDQSPAFHRYSLADSNCAGTATGEIYAGIAPIYTGRTYTCGKLTVPRQFAVDTASFDLAGYPAGVRSHSMRVNLSASYFFENGWEASSTTAYNTSNQYLGIDQDFSGIRALGGAFETFTKQPSHDFSQEFRISSDQTLPLRGLVGAYMYNYGNGHGYSGDLAGFNLTPGLPGNVTDPIRTTPIGPNSTIEYRALFGLLEYQFNDNWKASVEIRRGRDKIGAIGVDTRRLVLNGESVELQNAYSSTGTFTSTLPRFTVNYTAHEGLNFYALAAKGNKPGGYNVFVEDARLTEATRKSLIDQGYHTFEEETAWTSELGMKSQWLNNRLRFNASAFNIDWKNQQLTTNITTEWVNGQTSSNSFTSNAGKSRIRGLELEGEYLISREWLVTFSYSHLDTKIIDAHDLDFLNFIGSSNAKGKHLPQVPANTAALGVTYRGALDNGWGIFGNADLDYEGSRFGDATNLNWTGSATTLNLRLGIEPIKNLRLTAYVNNAFDNRTPEDILRYIDPEPLIAYPNLATGSGYSINYPRVAVVTARMPRMFGLVAELSF